MIRLWCYPCRFFLSLHCTFFASGEAKFRIEFAWQRWTYFRLRLLWDGNGDWFQRQLGIQTHGKKLMIGKM